MSWDLLVAGTQRITDQAYLHPTNSPIVVYNVHVVGSLSNEAVTFMDVVPTTTTTATTTRTLVVVTSQSSTGLFVGEYSNQFGVRFPNGCLIQTCSAFGHAIVNYVAEK